MEFIRKIIAEKRVDLEAVFDLVDNKGRGELITAEELARFLNKFEVYPSSSDLQGLMRRFDRNGTNKLNKKEFFFELQPKTR